jgi:competence protein ComEC
VKRSVRTVVFLMSLVAAVALSAWQAPYTLSIYVIDVEGGKATLVVSPSMESLLIDTGNIGEGARRDAGRILAAARDAGLRRIDHLVTTHWHKDHIGAMALVAEHLPIMEFIDHGANVQRDPPVDAFLQETYPALHRKSRHTIARAGDSIRVSGLEVRVVTSAGESIRTGWTGIDALNRHCEGFIRQPADITENAKSIGLHVTFGRFRVIDLGDATVNQEFELMCPRNPIGTVDLFMMSRHGQSGSNSALLVHALEPRVAIMNNGTRKGGQPDVMNVIHASPGLEDLWQLHLSELSGQEFSPPGLFIANLEDEVRTTVAFSPIPTPAREEALPPSAVHDGPAHWLRIVAQRDGSFSVTNGRNGFSKTYKARTR